MKGKQSFLRFAYPLIMKLTRLLGINSRIQHNIGNVQPPASFYALQTIQNNGTHVNFEQFKGKKVLLVNTASDCGWTAQYTQLQQLHQQYPQLIILGFPANDFKEQEKGSDADIAQFCQVNFGVTFPLMKKSIVVKTADQSNIFQWLSNASFNGWNDVQPEWNFSKYLVDEQGSLVYYFGPSVSPLSSIVTNAITHN